MGIWPKSSLVSALVRLVKWLEINTLMGIRRFAVAHNRAHSIMKYSTRPG